MDKIKLHLCVDPDSDLCFFPMVFMASDDSGDPNSFRTECDLIEKMRAVLSRSCMCLSVLPEPVITWTFQGQEGDHRLPWIFEDRHPHCPSEKFFIPVLHGLFLLAISEVHCVGTRDCSSLSTEPVWEGVVLFFPIVCSDTWVI